MLSVHLILQTTNMKTTRKLLITFTLLLWICPLFPVSAQDEQDPPDDVQLAEEKPVEPEPADVPPLNTVALCKTPEGRKTIAANYSKETLFDIRAQWDGTMFQIQSGDKNVKLPADTFEQYLEQSVGMICGDNPGYSFPIGELKLSGTCEDIKLGPPHFDIESTVAEIRRHVRFYRTSGLPAAGKNAEEREQNLKNAVNGTLSGLEFQIEGAYKRVYCKVAKTASCSSHTGQKSICDRTYMYAWPYQVFDPTSIKPVQHVKQGPKLESPTTAWFRVGKTGHGENWSTVVLQTKFSDEGAKKKARMDVDVIRRVLIAENLPYDREPEPLPVEKPPENVPAPSKKEVPGKIVVEEGYDPNHRNNYYVLFKNIGGQPRKFSYRLRVLNDFFSDGPRWNDCHRGEVTLQPGASFRRHCFDFRPIRFELRWNLLN